MGETKYVGQSLLVLLDESCVLPRKIESEYAIERFIVDEWGCEIRERFIAQRTHERYPFQKLLYAFVSWVFIHLTMWAQIDPVGTFTAGNFFFLIDKSFLSIRISFRRWTFSRYRGNFQRLMRSQRTKKVFSLTPVSISSAVTLVPSSAHRLILSFWIAVRAMPRLCIRCVWLIAGQRKCWE